MEDWNSRDLNSRIQGGGLGIGIVEWGLGFGPDRWDLNRCNLHSLRQILTLPIPPYNRFVTHKVRYAYVLLEV